MATLYEGLVLFKSLLTHRVCTGGTKLRKGRSMPVPMEPVSFRAVLALVTYALADLL